MLSLGPGSACDVCLEPFGADLKAPCSILCGHVFCVNCLQHLARPTCPLCRTPFEARHTIRLHIDLDSIRAPSSTEEIPIPTNVEEGVRQFQKRITELAVGGATEAQSTQLINDCKAFLAPIPKNLYIDLRTSHKMLMYMCQVKRNFVQQGRTVHQLTLDADSLSLEVDRLKAAIEALKIEKRRLEQLWQNVCNDRDSLTSECNKLHAELDNAEARILLVTEQNETAQNQLVLLNEELQRLRSEAEFSSPEGDSLLDFPPDLPPSISTDQHWPRTANLDSDSEDPESSAHFLTPWEQSSEAKGLPEEDLFEDPEPAPIHCPKPNGAYCGAAGCPHSCDCMPFVLFSPGSREAAAASRGARVSPSAVPSMSGLFISPGAPSGLFLSLNQDDPGSARSRSHSRPRSRSLSRVPSPANAPTSSNPTLPSANPLPPMASSMNIPNPHHELRGQLKDLLQDPLMSSSLPNMPPSHFPSSPLSQEFARYGANSPLYSVPPHSIPITPLGRPRDNHLHPPMLPRSGHPSPRHTSSPLSNPSNFQRPPLYRTPSGASHVVDDVPRSDKERRRAERSARNSPAIASDVRHTPMLRPQTHSLSHSMPPSNSQASSPPHPMSRPQMQHVSSLRLPSPTMPPVVPERSIQTGTLPILAPSFANSSGTHHALQQQSHSMPRAQAHALPSPTRPTYSASSPRQDTKPPSPPSQPRPPPAATYPTPVAPAPPTATVSVDSRAIYGAPASRRAAEEAPVLTTTGGASASRTRRSDAADARGGSGAAIRGTSKRMLAPAMSINPNPLSV